MCLVRYILRSLRQAEDSHEKIKYSSICSYIYKRRYLCDFLFASLGVTALPKGDLLLNERIFYDGSIFFPLTLKAPNENSSRQRFIFFYFYLSKEIRLDFSRESSAWQRIHMKYQVLFSLKNYEKVFINVVCCSRDCPSKVVIITNLGQRQKSALNAENTTDLPEILQVPSLCCFS